METKNLLKSLKRRLSGMLCLVMLLGFTTSAWADCRFYEGTIYFKSGKGEYTMSKDNSNEYSVSFYCEKSDTEFWFKINTNNKWYSSNGYSYHKDWTGNPGGDLCTDGGDDHIKPNQTTSSGWLKINVSLYLEYSGKSKIKQITQTAVSSISPSISINGSAPRYVGTAYTLTGSATGGSGSYKYEFFVDDTSLGSASATNTKSWTPSSAGDHKIKVKVTDNNCSGLNATSSETTVTITCTSPVISAHPSTAAADYCLNTAAASVTVLSVTASGTNPTYQWYSYTNSSCSSGETQISGATSNTYKPSTAAVGDLWYKCKVTACGSTAASDASGKITVNPNASIGSVSLTDSEVTVGGSTSATANGVVLGGGTGSWSSSDEDVATIDASSGLITAEAAGTATFTYTITGGCGGTVYKTTDALTVAAGCIDPSAGFAITGDWGDNQHFADAENSRKVTLTSGAQNKNNYQWYTCKSDGSDEHDVEWQYWDHYDITFDLPGTYYFKVKAGCTGATVPSAVKTVVVPEPEMRIAGPLYNGTYSCDDIATSLMDHTAGTKVWTKTFYANGNNQEFKIFQQYKKNNDKCSGTDGTEGWNIWDGGESSATNNIRYQSAAGSGVLLGSGTFTPSETAKAGDKYTVTVTMTAYNAYTVSMTKDCSAPTAGFDITGQLNVGKGSPYAGTVADGTSQGTGGYFGNSNRTITLNSMVGRGYQYEWVCTSGNTNIENWWNYGDTQTWENATANIKLPGTYKFKQKAKCKDAPNWVESEEITVVVPFPAMRINGPIVKGYDEVLTSDNSYEMERSDYTWTRTFNVGDTYNPENLQAFIVSQQYKIGTENDGWNRNQNTIVGQTTSTSGCDRVGSYHFNSAISSPALAKQEKVTVTVVMNAYNDYSVTLERICGKHWFSYFEGVPTSAICEGTEVTLDAHFDYTYGPVDTYQWTAPTGWTLKSQDGWRAVFTAGATTGTVTVTGALHCNNQTTANGTTDEITVKPLPDLDLSGSSSKTPEDAAATYPWEYMTITAVCDVTPDWELTGVPAGFTEDEDYVVEGSDKIYKIKAKQTANEDDDKFTFTVTATDNGCSTVKTFDVYINAAPVEVCE